MKALIASIALIPVLIGIIPYPSYAANDDFKLSALSLSDLQILDKTTGKSTGTAQFHISVSLKNQLDIPQQTIFITDIRDQETELSQSLQFAEMALKPFESSTMTSVWAPEASGKYEIRVFGISSLTGAEILSPISKRIVNVNLIEGDLTYSYPSEPFTIILLPDTQNYWPSGNEEMAYNQSQWIVNNKEKLNIQLVVHLGDLVNTWNNERQWMMADRMMRILEDNRVRYSVLPGNHDFGNPNSSTKSRNYDYFEQYFPGHRISNQTLQNILITENGANMYTNLRVGDNEFLIVSMEYCPTLDVIEQVNKVIRENIEKRVILATHAFLRADGSWTSVSGGGGVCSKIHGTDDYSTEAIWDLVVYPNPNIFLVVSGHSSGENKRIDNNVAGNPVQQILIDYQYMKNGGDGNLKIITFDPEKDEIYFKTYSPWLDTFQSRPKAEFTFGYNMN